MTREAIIGLLIRIVVTFVQGFLPAWALTNFSLEKGALVGAGAAALSVVYNTVVKPYLNRLDSVSGA